MIDENIAEWDARIKEAMEDTMKRGDLEEELAFLTQCEKDALLRLEGEMSFKFLEIANEISKNLEDQENVETYDHNAPLAFAVFVARVAVRAVREFENKFGVQTPTAVWRLREEIDTLL